MTKEKYRGEEYKHLFSEIPIFAIALGIINAYVIGTPWYIGLAVGILYSIFAVLGVIPIFGQLAYIYLTKLVEMSIGVQLMWVWWLGIIENIIFSIITTIIIILWKRKER